VECNKRMVEVDVAVRRFRRRGFSVGALSATDEGPAGRIGKMWVNIKLLSVQA
jgi:hypothetical protein